MDNIDFVRKSHYINCLIKESGGDYNLESQNILPRYLQGWNPDKWMKSFMALECQPTCITVSSLTLLDTQII